MKSTQEQLRFGRFTLIPAERRLLDDDAPVALNARYLDALILLARDPQAVITKDRLHDEVWRGVPVTDEALTQCIRALRKALGDDATSPTYIETVPKHGYRFIAQVEQSARAEPRSADRSELERNHENPALARAGAMTLGGAAAGALVGLIYGIAAAEAEGSSLSLLIVMICLAALAAGLSAIGVGLGVGLIGGRAARAWRVVLGGALGGFLTGGMANLFGRDAFRLLFGDAPPVMTGALEGLALGLSCGIGVALLDVRGRRAAVVVAVAAGGVSGMLVVLLGGAMLGGSLAALAGTFPASQIALPFAGDGSPLALLFGGFEGAAFAGGVVLGAILLGRPGARQIAQGKGALP